MWNRISLLVIGLIFGCVVIVLLMFECCVGVLNELSVVVIVSGVLFLVSVSSLFVCCSMFMFGLVLGSCGVCLGVWMVV